VSGARIEFLPEVLREIDDAFDWYFERSPQAAAALLRELDRAFSLITISPGIWPRYAAETRKYVLRNYPYNVIYREIPAGVEVIALAHHKRRPRYWWSRLPR